MQIHLLDEEVLEAAVTVQKLQCRRGNLKALQQKLQVTTATSLACINVAVHFLYSLLQASLANSPYHA